MQWHKLWLFLAIVFLVIGWLGPAILAALGTWYCWPR